MCCVVCSDFFTLQFTMSSFKRLFCCCCPLDDDSEDGIHVTIRCCDTAVNMSEGEAKPQWVQIRRASSNKKDGSRQEVG